MKNKRTQKTITDIALDYAKSGWKVFPCNHDKKPLTKHGFKDATTDPEIIVETFSRLAQPNIGIATGRGSNLVVVDVDKRSGGIETLHQLETKYGQLRTRRAQTGGGGFHLYFQYPDGERIKSGAGKGGEGIDIKAEGGCITAPPSIHKNGKPYEWVNGDDIAVLPAWLLQRIRSAKRTRRNCKKRLSEEGRNEALFHYLVKFAYRGLSIEELYTLGLAENQTYNPPMSDEEVRGRAKSTWDYVRAHKDNLEDNQAFVADFCVEKFAGDILHCRELQRWLYWNGEKWVMEGAYNHVKRRVIEIIRQFVAESRDVPDGRTQHIIAWANKVLNDFPIDRVLSLIAINKSIEHSLVEFDNNQYLLNCKNGTIDLKTGKLLPHNRDDLITKICPVKYHRKAKYKVWTQFTSLIADHNKDLRNRMLRFLGYCLTGDVKEELFAIFYGDTWTGKSTLLEPVKKVMGDYALTVPFETFIKASRATAPRPYLAKFPGKRFVCCGEFPDDARLDTATMKPCVAGDEMTVRDMYGKPFSFIPQCKICFSTNDLPHVPPEDKAMWRRTALLPTNHCFGTEKSPPDNKFKILLQNMEVAGPAILADLVNGCLEWQHKGLPISKIAEQAKQEYRDEQNPAKTYFDTKLEFEMKNFVPVEALYSDYKRYCDENNIKYPLGRVKFNRLLKLKGCRKAPHTVWIFGQKSRPACWIGVNIKGQPWVRQ